MVATNSERNPEGEENFRAERSYGSFQRTVRLATQVDPEYHQSFLSGRHPKSRAAKTKRIAVSLDGAISSDLQSFTQRKDCLHDWQDSWLGAGHLTGRQCTPEQASPPEICA